MGEEDEVSEAGEKDLMQAYTREAAFARCAKHCEILAGISFVADKMGDARLLKETAAVFREWETTSAAAADQIRRELGIK